jgi:hypothetical protein
MREISVEKSYAVKLVEACKKIIAGVFYGPEMTDGNIARRTDQAKVFRIRFHLNYI